MQKTNDSIEKLPPVITLKRVAEIAGTSRRTIRRWVRSGRLEANRVTGGGQLYFDTAQVLALLTDKEK